MLAGGIPAMLQFVSMLRLRVRRDELASVTISSLSRSLSLSLRAPKCDVYTLGSSSICVLGANDVSAVDVTYDRPSWTPSPLRIDGELVVDVRDTISFNGTVLTLSEFTDIDSSSLRKSTPGLSTLRSDLRRLCSSLGGAGL